MFRPCFPRPFAQCVQFQGGKNCFRKADLQDHAFASIRAMVSSRINGSWSYFSKCLCFLAGVVTATCADAGLVQVFTRTPTLVTVEPSVASGCVLAVCVVVAAGLILHGKLLSPGWACVAALGKACGRWGQSPSPAAKSVRAAERRTIRERETQSQDHERINELEKQILELERTIEDREHELRISKESCMRAERVARSSRHDYAANLAAMQAQINELEAAASSDDPKPRPKQDVFVSDHGDRWHRSGRCAAHGRNTFRALKPCATCARG